ncbi:MAG TPA: urate hydroxylase PuuD [Candidatus Saccharimonadia bacterium]|nr:urate hydroxylase PuuD [Candidatus Saccharimonadia bacterium]
MTGFLLESAGFLLRVLHLVAAIAWIGESFYFVMLDRALTPPKQGSPGVHGELWSVHGGGFYHKQKYLAAPPAMPEALHWSKWKSYTTWLSGFALFALLYLHSPQVYLIDPAVAALSPAQAIGLALAIPLLGWVAYDGLCRVVGFRDALLGALVAVLVLALAYAATHLFAGRAAFLIVGATLATIMSANVFFVIIPGQKRMVDSLARGETPDPIHGRRGKQRSVHNTYFTLPVVFAMLSIHFATAYAHPQSWLVLALFMAAGALIRQFFVLWHGGGRAWWLLGAGGALLAVAFAWLAPRGDPRDAAEAEAADAAVADPWGPTPTTAQIKPLISRHCSIACHGTRPNLLPAAPKALTLETHAQIERAAASIHQHTVVLRTMPPGNMTNLSEEGRAAIGRWYAAQPPPQ